MKNICQPVLVEFCGEIYYQRLVHLLAPILSLSTSSSACFLSPVTCSRTFFKLEFVAIFFLLLEWATAMESFKLIRLRPTRTRLRRLRHRPVRRKFSASRLRPSSTLNRRRIFARSTPQLVMRLLFIVQSYFSSV